MSSNERRERLLQILKKSDEPVKGSELSAELQVSRQVVVKDIALLRASGIEILATSSGYIKDVIVEHPTYGVLKAELNVSTNRDLKKFMEKATTNEFKQLSVLSPDYHIHTIEVSNKDIFEEIKKELRDKNILFE